MFGSLEGLAILGARVRGKWFFAACLAVMGNGGGVVFDLMDFAVAIQLWRNKFCRLLIVRGSDNGFA